MLCFGTSSHYLRSMIITHYCRTQEDAFYHYFPVEQDGLLVIVMHYYFTKDSKRKRSHGFDHFQESHKNQSNHCSKLSAKSPTHMVEIGN